MKRNLISEKRFLSAQHPKFDALSKRNWEKLHRITLLIVGFAMIVKKKRMTLAEVNVLFWFAQISTLRMLLIKLRTEHNKRLNNMIF